MTILYILVLRLTAHANQFVTTMLGFLPHMQTRKMPNKYTTWLIFLSEVILFTEIDLFGHLMMTKVAWNKPRNSRQ